jgi:hypothetical protein
VGLRHLCTTTTVNLTSSDEESAALTEGDFRQEGDTFFAFLVPESALEDNQVVIEACVSGCSASTLPPRY